MAWYLSRIYTRTPHVVSILNFSGVLPRFYSKFEVDVIDEFTSQLMQRKIGKWDQKKRKNEALLDNTPGKVEVKQDDTIRVDRIETEQLRLHFQNLFDYNDTKGVINLVKQCMESSQPPPFSLLTNILTVCSQNGEKDLIMKLQDLCKTHHPEFLKENSNFQHFLAEAIWVRGDISKSLEIFEEVYRKNAYQRRRIRLMFKCLVADLVANGSEAALSNTIGFSKRILGDFQDIFPMTCVWQACFLSEWFTDQNTAIELLETESGLTKSVINRIPYVVFVSLKCHRTEVVYRLLEVLLKHKMKVQYSNVLGSLLEYQFRFGDWVRCSEIIKWAVENEVPLPQNCNIEMINLILNQKMKTPLALLQKKEEQKKYDFKF